MKTEIVVFDGFDELDALAPFEVLRRAAAGGADLEAKLVTLDGTGEVTAQHGLRVGVEGKLGEPDVLIVPGGGWNSSSPRGVRAEYERGDLPSAIARLHDNGATVAGVCTGAMILAAAGLIEGRPATTHHRALEDLRDAGAGIVDARVVDDGDVLTAGGVTSGLDLALWLVERYFGARAASAVENGLEYERRGTVWQAVKA